jgi:hypothetical protein
MIVNDELERIWREEVVAIFSNNPNIYLWRLKVTMKQSSRIVNC